MRGVDVGEQQGADSQSCHGEICAHGSEAERDSLGGDPGSKKQKSSTRRFTLEQLCGSSFSRDA
jgi:hypothetical protein